MAKSPNITSISASFKIEYPNWPSTTGGQMTQIEPARTVSTEVANELARIDFMEQEISKMLTFPEAEAIINKIMNEGGSNV
ncbi:MAG: hypothetical protein ACKVJK_03565 [Methylophagaceae bacterium]|jgi:hypothetical protein|tara:strand:- start:270 stop:512 length:243 start_codon:yes stop_codon:yes gene_type:complete